MPGTMPRLPVICGPTCWPSRMSGVGIRSKSPSLTIRKAPPRCSSAGWKRIISVPVQWDVMVIRRVVAARREVR